MRAIPRMTSSPAFLAILRLILAAIFTTAGILKIVDTQSFADSIATFQLLPFYLINPVAFALPPLEILLGVLLVIGQYKSSAALGMLALSTIFALALCQALLRGLSFDCGCFGSSIPSKTDNWLSLGRDCLLAMSCMFLYYQVAKPVTLSNHAADNN